MDDVLESATKGKRGSNWTVDEELVVVEETRTREDPLFGKMKGSGTQKVSTIRSQAWQEIVDVLNSRFSTKLRSIDEVKKKYYNLKQRSKEKYDIQKRPKTGGGPAPNISQSEDALISDMLASSKSQLTGLTDGIDTDASISSCENSTWMERQKEALVNYKQRAENQNLASFPSDKEPPTGHTASKISSTERVNTAKKVLDPAVAALPTCFIGQKTKSYGTGKKRKSLQEWEEENFKLDNERLQHEIVRVKRVNENLLLEKEILNLKKQELIFKLQVEYPQFIGVESAVQIHVLES